MRRVDSIQKRQKLPKCPICGAEAFVKKNIVDGFYMGWSAGCPRYRIADGIHGVNTLEEAKERGYTVHGAPSKEEAVKRWIIIAKMEEKNMIDEIKLIEKIEARKEYLQRQAARYDKARDVKRMDMCDQAKFELDTVLMWIDFLRKETKK